MSQEFVYDKPLIPSYGSSPNQFRTFDSHGTRRPSDSTKNNFEEHFVSNTILASQRSKGVEVKSESQKRNKYHKIKQSFHHPSIILESMFEYKYPRTPTASSDVSIPNQNRGNEENEDTLVQEKDNVDQEEKLKNAAADKRTFDSHGTRRPSDSTKNNFEEHFVFNKNLACQRSKGVEVKSEIQKRDKYPEIKQPFHHPSMILGSTCVNKYKMTPPVSSDVSIPNQINVLPEEVRMELNNRSKSKQNSNKEERCNTQVNEKENEDEEEEVAENLQKNVENQVTSSNVHIPTIQDQIQDETLNPCITNGSNAIDKSLTKCDANIDKFCTHLDKDIAELSKEVKEVKQEAQNPIILDVHSEKEKVKNVLTKRLVQMDELQKRAFTDKSYQKKFKVEPLEKKALVVKDMYDLIDQYKVPTPPEDIAIYQTLNPSITNVRNAIDKSLKERDANIDKFCTHLDKDIAELSKEVKDVKQEAQNPIILDVHSEKEKVKNVLKKRLVQMDELQKRAFTDKSYQKKFKVEPLEKEALVVKDMYDLIDQYQVPTPPEDIAIYQMMNPSITNVRNAIDTSLTERDANIDKFCTHLDKDIAELSKEVKEVKQEAQEKVKNVLKKRLVQMDELQKRAFTDKSYQKKFKRHESTEASEGSANQPIHHTDICSDDHCTTFDSQEDNSTGMPGSMINYNFSNDQDDQIRSSVVNTDISSDESWSTVESTLIRLYENVVRNETSRMMSSIGIEAEHLFGLERSQIFLNLLDEELCQFGSAGALTDSVPNMAESTVRQNRLERHQPSDREENRPIYSIYFPSDCRLFISIPTVNGSYWHQSDMQRAGRIRQHSRKLIKCHQQ